MCMCLLIHLFTFPPKRITLYLYSYILFFPLELMLDNVPYLYVYLYFLIFYDATLFYCIIYHHLFLKPLIDECFVFSFLILIQKVLQDTSLYRYPEKLLSVYSWDKYMKSNM